MTHDTIEIPITEEELAVLNDGHSVKIITDETVEQGYVEIQPEQRVMRDAF